VGAWPDVHYLCCRTSIFAAARVATGSTLQLTGRARIDWNPAHSATGTDAERLVRFTPDDVVEIEGVLSQGLRLIEYSPFNPIVATE